MEEPITMVQKMHRQKETKQRYSGRDCSSYYIRSDRKWKTERQTKDSNESQNYQ